MLTKLKTIWRIFNNWRRSAFLCRLTILLLLLAFVSDLPWRVITENHSPLINELVWIACRAIRYNSEPSVESAYLRYYRARENQRMQNGLRDRVHSGDLRLNPAEQAAINAMPSKADNKTIFSIAKHYGVIPSGVSQREYMRSLWAASLAMTAMEFDKDWDGVKREVFSSGKLFSRTRDWRNGVYWFGCNLEIIAPIPVTATVPWFVICLTLAFIAVRNPSSKPQRALAITLPILLTLAWTSRTTVSIVQTGSYWNCFFPGTTALSYIIYFLILAVIPGILGIRLRRLTAARGNTDKVLTVLLFIAGALLMLHPIQCNYQVSEYTYWYLPPGNILFNISFGTMLLFYLSGAVMTGYAVKLYFRRKQ